MRDVDSVSLTSQFCLQGCRGPVHAQFVENWVAYHYSDVTNHRWEMSVLELYNKAQGNVTISDMVFGKISNSMSSCEPVPAEVRFVLPSCGSHKDLPLLCCMLFWERQGYRKLRNHRFVALLDEVSNRMPSYVPIDMFLPPDNEYCTQSASGTAPLHITACAYVLVQNTFCMTFLCATLPASIAPICNIPPNPFATFSLDKFTVCSLCERPLRTHIGKASTAS